MNHPYNLAVMTLLLIAHFGVNDLMQKARNKSDTVENLIENIRKATVKCLSHVVPKDFVSAIVRNKSRPESVLEKVHKKISFMCKNNILYLPIIAIFLILIYLMTTFTWWNRVGVF